MRSRRCCVPEADPLSSLAATQTFTSVGYGAYEVTDQRGGQNPATGELSDRSSPERVAS